jgi:hypothetical protein
LALYPPLPGGDWGFFLTGLSTACGNVDKLSTFSVDNYKLAYYNL